MLLAGLGIFRNDVDNKAGRHRFLHLSCVWREVEKTPDLYNDGMCAGKFSQCLSLTSTKLGRSKHPCGSLECLIWRAAEVARHLIMLRLPQACVFWRRSYISFGAPEPYIPKHLFWTLPSQQMRKVCCFERSVVVTWYRCRLLYICIAASSGCLRGWSQCFAVYVNNSVSFFLWGLVLSQQVHYFETRFTWGLFYFL